MRKCQKPECKFCILKKTRSSAIRRYLEKQGIGNLLFSYRHRYLMHLIRIHNLNVDMQLLAQCEQEVKEEFLMKRMQQIENVMQSLALIKKIKIHSVRASWFKMDQKMITHMCEFSFSEQGKNLYLIVEIDGKEQALKCEFEKLDTVIEKRQWRSFHNNQWIFTMRSMDDFILK